MRKIVLLILGLCLGTLGSLQASHIVGGEIFWKCTPNNQYIFTLVIYHDCSGAALPAGNQFINGPNGNIVCSRVAALGGPYTNGCSNYGCSVQRAVYISSPISLNGTPPATGWEFSWSNCCKYAYENAPGANATYLRSVMYPYQDPNSGITLNASSCYDNSPEFGQKEEMVVYEGYFEFNHLAMDQDQDSVVVEFADVFTASNTPAAFSAGYSTQSPFPDSTENPLNGPVLIEPHSGNIKIETYGATPGFYQNAVVAKSYRNNQLIAEVFRELPTRFVSNSIAGYNNTPQVAIDTALYPKLRRQGTTYRIAARNFDTIDFDIVAQDLDLDSSGTFQVFCANATGTKINSNNPTLTTGCPAGGPCATLLPASGGMCGTVVKVFNFNWVAQCQMLSAGLRGRTTYAFYIEVSDQACPYSKTGGITILVDLYPTQSQAPFLSITGGNVNGDIDFAWSKTQAQESSPFNQYILYGNTGPGTPFSAIDSISDRNNLSLSLNGQPFPAEYYMVQVAGSCEDPSSHSDTLNSDVILSMANAQYFPFEIYPQPAKSSLSIRSSAISQLEEAVLYDLKGAELARYSLKAASGIWELSLNQKPGMYLLSLEGESQTFRKRIIIQ